jgi:hypothetical protein
MLIFSSSLFAAPIHQNYQSIRAMGMGNAFTAMSDDENTLYFNPAGLAWLREGHINLSLANVAVSTGEDSFIDLYSDIKDASDAEGTNKEVKMAETIEKLYGKNFYARFSTLNFTWARKGWGIGLIPVDLTLNVAIHQQVGPSLVIDAMNDTTITYGRGWKFRKVKGLSIGGALKTVYREYFGFNQPAIELAQNSGDILDKDEAKEGLTLDADIGVLYKVPYHFYKIRPVFSAVVRNLFDYGFSKSFNLISDKDGKPKKLERRFDLGSKIAFPEFFRFKPSLVMDIRDMGHSNWTLRKGIHMGAELKWKGWYILNGAVRAGLNQGRPTFGASMKMLIFLLEYATFGREIGTKNLQKENRVHVVKLSMDF